MIVILVSDSWFKFFYFYLSFNIHFMKNLFLGILLSFPVILSAQNLQLHYDFGQDRKFFTSTLEMFKPDTLGSTFWFVDFDFNFPGAFAVCLQHTGRYHATFLFPD